jgi:hypothetical protein
MYDFPECGAILRLSLDAQDLTGVAADQVDPAIRALFEIADFMLTGEERFLADDCVTAQNESV